MKKFTKGFTLVELIIVIVIIGILAAISIIGYANQANKARNNSAYAALSEAVKAANICLANGDTLTAVAAASTASNVTVCGGSGAVSSGHWPVLSDFGTWEYRDIAKDAYAANDPAADVDNSIGSGVVNIGATNNAVFATTNPAVICAITGCTKKGTW